MKRKSHEQRGFHSQLLCIHGDFILSVRLPFLTILANNVSVEAIFIFFRHQEKSRKKTNILYDNFYYTLKHIVSVQKTIYF